MKNQFNIVDLSYLRTIADGNDEIIKELIEIFVDQVPEFTDGLIGSFASKDWNSISALAHKAKSSVISMGMKDVGENDLKNLELLAKNRRIKDLKESLSTDNSSSTELERLIANLEGYPEEKQKWVAENDRDETIKKIIDKFVAICDKALVELNSVLEN